MSSSKAPGDGSRRLLNANHEMIARAVAVRGMSNADAVRSVLDLEGKWTSQKAQKEGRRICVCTPTVVARIQWLTDQKIVREMDNVATSKEWVTAEMVKTYQDASSDGHWPAAVKALELLGIEHGMFVRRTQVEHSRKPIEVESREELIEQFVQLARDAFGPSLKAAELRQLFRKTTGVELDVVDADVLLPEKASPSINGAGSPPGGSE
jgi:hypothetical protein